MAAAPAAAKYGPALQLKLSECGLQGCVEADAYAALLQYVADVRGDLEVVHGVLDTLKAGLDESGFVTRAQVEAAVRLLEGAAGGPPHVVVVDAFRVPRVRYDGVSKRLVEDAGCPATLQAPADSKVSLHQGRFNLLYQRLRRNARFAPLNAVQASLPNRLHVQLAELTGLKGSVGRRCVVLGLIGTQEDGTPCLEDEGAVIPVDLSAARLAAGLVTENCVVVAEGQVGHDGVFHVTALASPCCERRDELPATARNINFFGAPPLTPEDEARLQLAEDDAQEDRVVFLANVWLDQPATFDALHTLLSGFQDAGAVPSLLVFMGDFTARGTAGRRDADFPALREGFGQLARLIDTYPAIKERTRCVFVPGPNDPGLGRVLPQPRLPPYFTAELAAALPTAVFATNPCRIRYYTRELVVFRYDLTKALRRRALVTISDEVGDDPERLFQQVALTVLQQSCLVPLPLPVQPVHWAHDQALSLYPLPHAVVLADASPQAVASHEGCTVFNPGCLQERNFAAYLPLQDEVEPCELPPPRDGGGDTGGGGSGGRAR